VKRWTWREARALALAILYRAEQHRRRLAEAEAAFYADAPDAP
jgi:hypothetical protein